MIQLSFLGAMSAVGASGVLVDTGSEKIVLDYGAKIQNEGSGRKGQPQFPLHVDGKVDAICLSHCHLDHSGGLPILFKDNRCPIYAVDVAKPLTQMLLHDSLKISKMEGTTLPFNKVDVRKTVKNFFPVEYKKVVKVHNAKIVNYDAGHIPGSMMTSIRANGKNILYTGDMNIEATMLVKGADTKLPKVDALITECTYSNRDHIDRKREEKTLVRLVNSTLANDGIAVVSCFAIGRTQEILLILDKYGIDYSLYMDGMSRKATTIINRFNNRLNNPKSLDKALKKVKYVNSQRERKKIIKQPCVILTTSGMLNGGPVAWYIKQLHNNRDSSLLLTGYQVEGTPGRILMETGKYINEEVDLDLRMLVRRLDFSSHVGRTQLLDFINRLQPKQIFCVHGDHTEEFARELQDKGFNAVAPVANNRIFRI